MKTLKSNIDESVNYITKAPVGYFESRYVRRTKDYFTCYLSCQSGCNLACKQCFLTASGQTQRINASLGDLIEQVKPVIEHYKTQDEAKIINYSFMARGEVLDSNVNGDYLLELGYRAKLNNLKPRYCISTIMPKSLNFDLVDRFLPVQPDLYYSIYSTNSVFKSKWMPNAMEPEMAIKLLADYQNYSKKIIKLHWPFIKNENDSEKDVLDIIKIVNDYKLRVDVNIVMYNPYSDKHGEESDITTIYRNCNLLKSNLPGSVVKLVDRVGQDVFGSCGTFCPKNEILI